MMSEQLAGSPLSRKLGWGCLECTKGPPVNPAKDATGKEVGGVKGV